MIGLKTWDRIVGFFLRFSVLAVTAQKFRGLFGCFNSKIFALNHGLIWIEPGMAMDCGSQGEPLICDFSGIVTKGFTIPEIVF